MLRFGRRAFVQGAALLPSVLAVGHAEATLMRGLTLRALVSSSHHVLVVTGLDARCTSVQIGGSAAIITETRVRIADVLGKPSPSNDEFVIRTLGGVLNGVGELVHGQAVLLVGERCVAFLTRAPDTSLWVTGMAQGHYPLASIEQSNPRLQVSPNLPSLRDFEQSAVRALVGQGLAAAGRLISAAESQ